MIRRDDLPLDHGYGVAIGTVTAWQVRFNAQSLHTDDHGLPV